MGRFGTPQLGYMRDDDDNDIPELNKCPACGAFFEGDVCPICKTVCPEEMKAGNRKPPSKNSKKKKKGKRIGYKVPLPLYQRTWFIVVALFVSKLVGIILVWTSDWKKWVKVIVTILALFGTYLYFILFSFIQGLFYKPSVPVYVDTSISESQYREKCTDSDYSALMRYPDKYAYRYIGEEFTVIKVTEGYEERYGTYGDFILCNDTEGNGYVLFDCRTGRRAGILAGDTIRAFGQFGYVKAVSAIGDHMKYPVVYTAYIDTINTAQ